MRLGFAVKVLGRPQLKSHDSRRWQNQPHLSVSLMYVRDILVYLADVDIAMYRMQSDLAPYVTHPDHPEFHHQVKECETELAHLGKLAREKEIRLSFHAHPYTVLNATDADIAARSAQAIEVLAAILEGMGLGDEAVIVTHVGGVYGDPKASLERFAQRYKGLSAGAQRRLVLENDENRYSLIDTYGLHEETGIRLVLDRLHHLLNNPARLSIRQALDLTLSTWPEAQTPKIHFSSPRTEFKVVPEEAAAGDGEIERLSTPSWRNHADYINPFEFANFLRAAEGSRDFDVMLETKAKDLALLRLREDLTWYTPELAKRWGLDT